MIIQFLWYICRIEKVNSHIIPVYFFVQQYRNMGEVLAKNPQIIDNALEAIKRTGLKIENAVRKTKA